MQSLVEASELKFEHRKVKLIAIKSITRISVAGSMIGPLEEGSHFEAMNWVAEELTGSGAARLLEAEKERLNIVELQKVQIRETIQSSRRLSTLPEGFYPKLRRLLRELNKQSISKPEKVAEYQKATQLTTDILTSRLNKILLLASAQAQTESVLQSLTPEERLLYKMLHHTVNEWRSVILKS